jgi:DNA polymerase-3 subunit beta
MKFNINTKEARDVVNNMNSVISTRTTLPEASCVLIKACKKHVEFTATDLDSRAKVGVMAEVTKEGAIAISAYILSQALSKAATDTVEFSVSGDELTIISGKSKFKIYGMDAKVFPPEFELQGKPVKIDFDGYKFAGWCERLLPFTPKGTERPEFQMVCIDADDEGCLVMFVTNGKISGMVSTGIKTKSIKRGERKNLPATTLQKFLKFSPSGSILIEIYENAWRAIFENGEFTAKQAETSYPDFQSTLKQLAHDQYDEYEVSTKELRNAVSVASVAADQYAQMILSVGGGKLSAKATSHAKSEAESEIECETIAEPKTIKLSSAFFQEAVKRVSEDRLSLKIGHPEKQPLVFEDKEHLTIIMPMRMQ